MGASPILDDLICSEFLLKSILGGTMFSVIRTSVWLGRHAPATGKARHDATRRVGSSILMGVLPQLLMKDRNAIVGSHATIANFARGYVTKHQRSRWRGA